MVLKWLKDKKDGINHWVGLYTDALANRLRRDKNLGDLTNPAAARENLQLTGDVTDHHHDSHYEPMIQKLREDVERYKAATTVDFRTMLNEVKAINDRQDRDINDIKGCLQENSVGVIVVDSEALIVRGFIMEWYGGNDNIPQGWHICDGTAGTPDLSALFHENVIKIMKL
jgi:hypothetical protein